MVSPTLAQRVPLSFARPHLATPVGRKRKSLDRYRSTQYPVARRPAWGRVPHLRCGLWSLGMMRRRDAVHLR